MLYVPASRPRMLERLPALPADLAVVDLEDGVAPSEKAAARAHVREAAARRLLEAKAWALRVNADGDAAHEEDLSLAEAVGTPGIVLPKAERAETVARVGSRAAAFGAWVGLVIETARGVAAAGELAAAHPSVALLLLGSADLRLSLRARPDDERRWELHALSEVPLAARAEGCAAVDGVHFRYRDAEGLRKSAAVARDLGYDGKSAIHPDQVAVIHEVFSPTPAEAAWAAAVIEGWARGDGESRGVVVVDGEMIEALHVTLARRILSRV